VRLPGPTHLWICSPLFVKADTRNHQNQQWGKLLEFPDKDGNQHCCLMFMSELVNKTGECCAQLLNQGLRIAPGRKARELVIEYVLSANPKKRIRCSSRLGWHKSSFVLPEESIQPEGSEPTVYQSASNSKHWSAPSGTLESWINDIGRFCRGNPRLLFAVACGFASPLLQLTNEPGGGFHFYGPSSSGKTTALLVAASVWGGGAGVQTWRMNRNSTDAIGANHNDRLLCLDELGKADANEVGAIVYAFANGSPKQRMH
jgi:putative DNA primase/helicase